jgi:hypothetical protein
MEFRMPTRDCENLSAFIFFGGSFLVGLRAPVFTSNQSARRPLHPDTDNQMLPPKICERGRLSVKEKQGSGKAAGREQSNF